MTKSITPHKGGRTERLALRVTPETKERAKQIAKELDVSIADLFDMWVKNHK